MHDVSATSAEDFAFNLEFGVGGTVTIADKPIQWEDIGEATTLVDHARALVRRADVTRRQGIARRFAGRARPLSGVREIRLTAEDDDLLVTVLTEQRDIELDLALQRIFIEVTAGYEGAASLRTRLYGYDDPEQDGDLI